LLGPLPVGETEFRISDLKVPPGGAASVVTTVAVRDDRVTFIECVSPERNDPPTASNAAQPASTPKAQVRSGRVVGPDGTTPVGGAHVVLFRRDATHAGRRIATDSDGRFIYHLDYSLLKPSDVEAGPLVAGAWLPGSFAPTTVPLPEDESAEIRVVLNAGHRVKGRVTIGGDPADVAGGRLQVRFAPDRTSPFDPYLYDALTPSVDGAFELGGLPTGAHRAQAALDGIWLSATKRIMLAEGADDDAVLLDVGRPGIPSVINCVDRNGKPITGATVTLRRPEGPLTQELWPKAFTSDAGGAIHLPPLEVGTHTFRTSRSKLPYEVRIEPLPATGGGPHRQTIVVD
jgi:hypothetical protein